MYQLRSPVFPAISSTIWHAFSNPSDGQRYTCYIGKKSAWFPKDHETTVVIYDSPGSNSIEEKPSVALGVYGNAVFIFILAGGTNLLEPIRKLFSLFFLSSIAAEGSSISADVRSTQLWLNFLWETATQKLCLVLTESLYEDFSYKQLLTIRMVCLLLRYTG